MTADSSVDNYDRAVFENMLRVCSVLGGGAPEIFVCRCRTRYGWREKQHFPITCQYNGTEISTIGFLSVHQHSCC